MALLQQPQPGIVARVRNKGVMMPFILLGGHICTLSGGAKSIQIFLVQVVYCLICYKLKPTPRSFPKSFAEKIKLQERIRPAGKVGSSN